MSVENRLKFGVSTATFTEQTNLGRHFNFQEVKDTLLAASELGDLGVEIVYRKWGERKIAQILKENTDLVFTLHAPIWSTLPEAFIQGWQEEGGFLGRTRGAVQDALASALLFGCLKGEFESAQRLAQKLNTQKVIVHPWGAKFLGAHGFKIPQTKKPTEMFIEPDSRRAGRDRPWIWRKEEVLELAKRFNFGIALDLSHTIIAQNNLDLRTPYEFLKDDEANRIKVIHLNATIPSGDDGIPKPADRGLPITDNERVLGVIKEFYQQLVKDQFNGVLIFEYFQRRGESFGERINILDRSREALVGGNAKTPSFSTPNQPTTRT